MIKEINHISDPIALHIWVSLHNYDYANALFAAERLYAETKCDESLFLLATCFYRLGRPKQVCCLLKTKGSFSSKCRYLLAKCCWDTGLTAEAESAIVGPLLAAKSIDEVSSEFGDQACYVLLLLGDIYRYTDRLKKAAECYRKCLAVNPLMWSAFEYLCNMGEEVDPIGVFTCPEGLQISTPTLTITTHSVSTLPMQPRHQHNPPFSLEDQHDSVLSRENMNPSMTENSTFSDVTGSTAANDQSPLGNSLPFYDSQGSMHSYTSDSVLAGAPQSVMSQPRDSLDSPDGLTSQQYTPENQGTAPMPITAPKALRTLKKPGRNLFSSGGRLLDEDNNIPTFGLLSMNFQSPMFASVPLFSPMLYNSSMSPTMDTSSDNSLVSRRLRTRRGPTTTTSASTNSFTGGPYRRVATHSNNTSMTTSTAAAPGVLQSAGSNRSDPIVLRSSRGGVHSPTTVAPEIGVASGGVESGSPGTPRMLGAKENTAGSQSGSSGPRTRAQAAKAAAQRRTRTRDKKDEEEKDGPLCPGLPPGHYTQHSSSKDPRRQSLDTYLALLRDLASAYQLLSSFQCQTALSALDSLPPSHYYTGLVLAWAARAHMELTDYQAAARLFSELRQLEPWQLRGMEAYSTALWHLAKDISLSSLAGDLLELDRGAPEPWCAAGNCFSLQREHEVAVRYFKRALQVQPRFTYAYTLLGHEYTLMEELDHALTSFRQATRLDHRHYNAWYGLSNVYFRQDKFSLAELHLNKATDIFSSPILLTNLGVVRARLGRIEGPSGALVCLERACHLSPKNPMCKYHRSSVLVLLERYSEALEELEQLRQLAPKESMVYFMLGRLHRKLGNTPQALINFSWAMDLDPKGANSQLKDIFNTRNPVNDALFESQEISVADSTATGPPGAGVALDEEADNSAFGSL